MKEEPSDRLVGGGFKLQLAATVLKAVVVNVVVKKA
jgi:hypothetical protein